MDAPAPLVRSVAPAPTPTVLSGEGESGTSAMQQKPSGAATLVRSAATAVFAGVERPSRPVRSLAVAEYLRWRARPFDLMHVHGAHKAASARRIGRPLAVHLHGSDIRVMHYAQSTARSVRQGVLGADLVVYATPDLLDHAAQVRTDVHYLPVPISTADLPKPPPEEERRGVLFVSRWEASKGGERMLDIAQHLQRWAPEVPVYGLDWGDGADQARRAGVTLLPRRPHAEFLNTVASHRVAIGQANPMIGTSELEALALGLPLIGSFDQQWYSGLGKLSENSAEKQAEAAILAHREVRSAREEQDGGGFVLREHDTPRVLSRLVELYGPMIASV